MIPSLCFLVGLLVWLKAIEMVLMGPDKGNNEIGLAQLLALGAIVASGFLMWNVYELSKEVSVPFEQTEEFLNEQLRQLRERGIIR